MGRRGAVEVPRGRLGRPVGGAGASARSRRRRTRTRATAPTGSRCCATGSTPRRSCSGSSPPTTAATSGSSASSTRTAAPRRTRAPECIDWAGHRTGACYAAQGNILVGAGDGRRARRRRSRRPRARRLARRACSSASPPRSSRAATAAASSRRRSSIVERDGGYAQLSDVVVDLRVDDHPRPIEELRRIYTLHDRLFGTTPRDGLAAARGRARATRCDERLAAARLRDARRAGRASRTSRSASTASDAIDPVVLEALREDVA